MSELLLVAARLQAAKCPEDVFPSANNFKATFHSLAKVVHPDNNNGDPVAQLATAQLLRLKEVADKRVLAGTYGDRTPLPEHAPLVVGKYVVERAPLLGDVTDVYFAAQCVVKAARSVDDNDLLLAERGALEALKTGIATRVVSGVPELLDKFQIGRRNVNVLERYKGWYTAEEVRAKVPGLDARNIVWMFKRLLVLLEWTHKLGFVHGAILPPHVLFYPDNDEGSPYALPGYKWVTGGARGGGKTLAGLPPSRTNDPRKHSIRLIDWCYSLEYAQRTRLSAWCPAWKDHYPSELLEKRSIGPSSDIYMAARLMQYLAGSTTIPAALQEVIVECTCDDPARRYQSAGKVFDDWSAAALAVYGLPKWFDFEVPK